MLKDKQIFHVYVYTFREPLCGCGFSTATTHFTYSTVTSSVIETGLSPEYLETTIFRYTVGSLYEDLLLGTLRRGLSCVRFVVTPLTVVTKTCGLILSQRWDEKVSPPLNMFKIKLVKGSHRP